MHSRNAVHQNAVHQAIILQNDEFSVKRLGTEKAMIPTLARKRQRCS